MLIDNLKVGDKEAQNKRIKTSKAPNAKRVRPQDQIRRTKR